MHTYTTYKNILSSFIRVLQKNGIKESSELVLKDVFSIIKKTTKKSPFLLFRDALDKAKPFCEIKSIRISGTNYKVPVEIKPIPKRIKKPIIDTASVIIKDTI